MKIAAIAYACERLPDRAAQRAKLDTMLRGAAADLVILPEYAAMESALIGGPTGGTALDWRDRAADHADEWLDQFRPLAAQHNCHILAGSGPVRTDRGVVNRAWLIAPSGSILHQDKLILTPYERDEMQMVGGTDLTLFDTALGKIGVLVCYDSEFPLLARALTHAGADMLLVPSCTDLPAGQTRVRQSARARAIENQCLVIQAPLVGRVDGCDVIDQSTGRAGFFTPPDVGQPSNGIAAQGETDAPGAVLWTGDPATIAAPRLSGQVGNFAHWPEQENHIGPVKTLALA